jgi:hypothetical protein
MNAKNVSLFAKIVGNLSEISLSKTLLFQSKSINTSFLLSKNSQRILNGLHFGVE